ncbi:MAG: hypothetical protein P4L63_03620 [Candidatus Pacebacteria bacterium]|nr:hypothetical protein [Candidatus Paceibacterota bacterium]
MENKIKNKEGGFIELIILIIIALLIMKYFGITISGVVNWFESFFRSVLR